MQDFDWIRRAFLGLYGSAITVVLDHVNTIFGLIIGILTMVYIVQQIRLSAVKKRRAEFEYQQGIIDRRRGGDSKSCPSKHD